MMLNRLSRPLAKSTLIAVTLVSLGCFGNPTSANAQGGVNAYVCGGLFHPGQFGPFDYRTAADSSRRIVEDHHFTPNVEMLQGGQSGSIGGDLDYTLRALPNSPRALLSLSRYATKVKTERAPGLNYTTECYFERAIRFVPDDPMPHVLYASYLRDRKRNPEARAQLDEAERVRGEPINSDVDYNVGLLYFDLGMYEKALQSAQRAYALGAQLPALKKKLKAAGKWQE